MIRSLGKLYANTVKKGVASWKELLSKRPELISEVDQRGRTLLVFATCTENIEVIQMLLDFGADALHRDNEGISPLMIAAQMNHCEILSRMLQKCKHTITDELICEMYVFAADSGNVDILRYLAEHGYENKLDNVAQPLLYWGVQSGSPETVLYLLEAGYAVDETEFYNMTPLYLAAAEGRDEIVQILIDHGADLNIASEDGVTPLEIARHYGNVSTVERLINHGAE